MVLGGHFSFLGFCIKECDVNKWAKPLHLPDPHRNLVCQFISAGYSRITGFVLLLAGGMDVAAPPRRLVPLGQRGFSGDVLSSFIHVELNF